MIGTSFALLCTGVRFALHANWLHCIYVGPLVLQVLLTQELGHQVSVRECQCGAHRYSPKQHGFVLGFAG